MAQTASTKKKSIRAMFSAFMVLIVATLTAPFVDQTKHTAPVIHQKTKGKTSPVKSLALCGLAVMGMIVIIAPASAATLDLNGTIGPILDGVSALIPSIVNLIVSVVPAIIVLAVVGFIVAFLDKILSMLKL